MNNKVTDFKRGDKVLYQPGDTPPNLYHPSANSGTVTSVNANFVFVDYQGTGRGIATDPKDLRPC